MSTPQSSTVAIAHTNEKHRSVERAYGLVRQAIDLLGGMSRFVRPGQSVLLKPNQTVFYSAEEGCTTDPVVIGALIRLCKEAGAKRVIVGESSGGFFNSIQCMKITGIAAVAEKEGAELVDLGGEKTEDVPIPNERLKSYPRPVSLGQADVIIDVPKCKNHHIEPISGALKNWMGTLNREWRQHHHGHPQDIGLFMDIMKVRPPDLVVSDGLIAGEGDGPIANLPHWLGCIIATTDPVANDVTICKLMGRDWTKMKYCAEAENRGLGTREHINYLGVPIERVAIDAWPGHSGFGYLPINFIVGEGATLDGTIGHVKSVLDSMLRRGDLWKVVFYSGTPTIMVGEAEDPNFEQHLKEGPYIVFDDAAREKYKNDPRVYFVSGHPVLRRAMPELFKGLGAKLPGNLVMKGEEYERRLVHNLEYGTPMRKAKTLVTPIAVIAGLAGLAAGAAILGTKLLRQSEPPPLASRLRRLRQRVF